MILIGMFDSPFVRRVAISMTLLDVPFEHCNWSVGRDAARIREFNPLARVPTLVLDSGESLIESAMILDYLDQQAGEARALLPSSGEARRRALSLIALATGAADKGIQTVYERIFRPPEKRYEPWTQRCRTQMHAALAELEVCCAAPRANDWLLSDTLSQADITLACYLTYLREAVPFDLAAYPALLANVEPCEVLPVFKQFYVPFDPPDPN
nr:glutathione S-transferase family protein [Pseudomonadota bacterium]